MPFNFATFQTRLFTAAVFVAVMLTGLLWNEWSFFVLFSIVHFGAWFEFQKIVSLIDPGYKKISLLHKYGVMLAGWFIMLFFTSSDHSVRDNSFQAIGWWAGIVLIVLLPLFDLIFTRKLSLRNIRYSGGGLMYISVSLALLIDMYTISYQQTALPSVKLPLFIILAIWINDTMAYLVGSFIGRTPFSKISPKKTWEGTIGGMIFCIVIMGLMGSGPYSNVVGIQPGMPIPNFNWYVIATIIAITGTIGDLFESKLKRTAGIKDSGQIMPGHGGFLDRFDSLLFATPFVWAYIQLAF